MCTKYIRYTSRAYLYCPQRGKFLFTRGILPPFGYHVPGGGINKGESVESALRRELYEELAIVEQDIVSITFLKTIKHNVYGIPHISYIHLVVLTDPKNLIPRKISWEVPGVIWRDLTDTEKHIIFSQLLPVSDQTSAIL